MAATFTHIEPASIPISRARPLQVIQSSLFYLGYQRNAWWSTWINRYNSDSVSESVEYLKIIAENRRVSGSVFKIQSLPSVVLKYRTRTICLCPINEMSSHEYDFLFHKIEYNGLKKLFTTLPSSDKNWILAFNCEGKPANSAFVPKMYKSMSFGSKYKLSWSDKDSQEEQFSGFCNFRLRLEEFVKTEFREKAQKHRVTNGKLGRCDQASVVF